MLSAMEQKFELKGPAGLISAAVVVLGLLVWKGPEGLKDLLTQGRTMPLSDKVLNSTGRQEIHNELMIHYRRQFQDPLTKAVGEDPGSDQAAAEKLIALTKVLHSLKIESLDPRFRNRLDTGDRLELYIDATYSMQPAPPDGRTNRTFSVDIEKNGRVSWHVRSSE